MTGPKTGGRSAEVSQNLRRTVNNTWAANGSPSSTTVILEDGQQAKTEATFDAFGNLTLFKEYDYGASTPTRTTEISYETGTNYINRNLRGLVKQVLVREGDATGAIKSRTDIAYDEPAYLHTVNPSTDCTSSAQHDDAGYGCSFYTRGNATTVTTYENAAAGTGAVARHAFYDFMGNVRKADVNCCQVKEYIYTTSPGFAYPGQVKHGPAGSGQLMTSTSYNFYTGQVTSSTDANGKVTSFAYAPITNRLTTVTRPDSATIDYAYDDSNRTVVVDSPLDGTSKARQKSYFDKLGRMVKAETTSTAGGDCSASAAEYDALSRPFRRSNPFVCAGSPTHWTTSAFDGIGRLLSVTVPDGSATTYSYAGNTATVTDPTGKQRKSETDAYGRLKKLTEPDVNDNNSLTQYSTYTYNTLDLLTLVIQGVQTRTYVYDDLGRMLQETTPEAGTWSNQYNAFNQVTQRTDARGVVKNFTYDSLNRLIGVSYTVPQGSQVSAMSNVCDPLGGPTPTANVCYFYDEGGAAANALGRLTRVVSPGATEVYSYDGFLGRMTQVQWTINSVNYVMGNQYNQAGGVTQITYPSGRMVTQGYDDHGRLASIQSIFSSVVTKYVNTFQYNAATGQVNSFKYGDNAVDAAFTYSPDRLQVTGLSYKKNGDLNPFFHLSYGYGPVASNNGQIMSITDNVEAGRTVNYSYDALHRLKTALTSGSASYPQWGLSWTYDRYGNRDAQTVTHGTAPANDPAIDPSTNRISDHCFDANGNLLAETASPCPPPAPMYVYDGENRVTSFSSAGGSGTYSYSGAGLRVKKVSGTTTTVYVYSGTKVIAEYENGAAVGSPTREYAYSGSLLIATHESGAVKYHYHDHLSMRVTSDAAGGNRSEQGHYPFGDSQMWYTVGTQNKVSFTSYERDGESSGGNDYAVFRTYTNRFGRFSRPDPIAGSIGNPQSLNRYAYTRNDPVNLVDPLGLFVPSGSSPPLQQQGTIVGYLCFYVIAHWASGNSTLLQFGPCRPVRTRAEGQDRRDPPERALVMEARDLVLEILSGENPCAEFFAGSPTLEQENAGSDYFKLLDSFGVDDDYLFGDLLGPADIFENVGFYQRTTTGTTGADTQQGTGARSNIFYNLDGWFFHTTVRNEAGQLVTPRIGGYSGNTLGIRVLGILHEHAHNVNLIPSDKGNPNQSTANTDEILEHCLSTVISMVGRP